MKIQKSKYEMKVLLQRYVENIKSCLRKNKAFTSFGRYELQKKKKKVM